MPIKKLMSTEYKVNLLGNFIFNFCFFIALCKITMSYVIENFLTMIIANEWHYIDELNNRIHIAKTDAYLYL